jgi:site-specific DNA-methyltransferase (cytosine-N4-specific)
LRRSDLPFGSEFSPSQVDLPHLLELSIIHGGNWQAFEKAVRTAYFEGHITSEYNKNKLANNTKLGMIAYGIIDRNANLTEFGQKLYNFRHNDTELYTELARHILLNLHGITLIQCIQDMQAAGEVVKLTKLREWLEERGTIFPRGGKHASIMRLWLEKAGVFQDGWRVNEARLQEILGSSTEEIEVLSMFSKEQKTFLKTLGNLGGGTQLSNEIEKLATATFGIKFDEKSLPKQVLYPLAEAGYITLERGTKEKGRGAKPFSVTATEKFNKELITPILEQLEKQTSLDLRPMLRKQVAEILNELKSENKHVAGLALEALGFKLMRLLDMTYIATRLKGAATGGAEVDLIFESARLVFSRWQIQCKNTARVSLDDLAKEVGLTHSLKSNVIVIFTTGEIGSEARRYANKIMTDSNLCIVLVNGHDLNMIRDNQTAIVDVFLREAKNAMKLKTLEI